MTSWQGKALISEYRLTRRKRTFASARALRRSAESHQAENTQLPHQLSG